MERGHTPSLSPNAHPVWQDCRDVLLYGCRRNPDHGSALHFLPAPESGGLLGLALHCKHTCPLTCCDTCLWGRGGGGPPQPRNLGISINSPNREGMVTKRYPGRGSRASHGSPTQRPEGPTAGQQAARTVARHCGLPGPGRAAVLPPVRPPACSLTRSAGRAPGSSAASSRRVPGSAGPTAPARPAAPRGPARPCRQLAPGERPDGGGHAPGRRRTCWRATRAAGRCGLCERGPRGTRAGPAGAL